MLLIRKGRGILIPVFWLTGGLIGVFFAEGLRLSVIASPISKAFAGRCLFVGGALASWLCALTICKSEKIITIDPRTRRQTVETDRHTFYFIPAIGWAILMSLIAAAVILRPAKEVEGAPQKAKTLPTQTRTGA